MNKAIFLDRDGVINRKGKNYYIFTTEDFEFNDGVFEALALFRSMGYLLIVITNQGGISRKVFTEQQLELVHNYMKNELKCRGAELTGIYYCPHHPENEICSCRKPGTLLFERAIKDFSIDPALSYMIGDSETDMIAAKNAGITGIKIPENGNIVPLFREYKF